MVASTARPIVIVRVALNQAALKRQWRTREKFAGKCLAMMDRIYNDPDFQFNSSDRRHFLPSDEELDRLGSHMTPWWRKIGNRGGKVASTASDQREVGPVAPAAEWFQTLADSTSISVPDGTSSSATMAFQYSLWT